LGESKLLMPSVIFSIPVIKDAPQNGLLEKHILQKSKKAFSDYFARGGRGKKSTQDFVNSLYVSKKSNAYTLMTKHELGEEKEQTVLELQKSGKIKRQKYPRKLDSGDWVSASILKKNFLQEVVEDCVAYYVALFLDDTL